MSNLISAVLSEVSPKAVALYLVDHADVARVSIVADGGEPFGGRDPKLSTETVTAAVFANPKRCFVREWFGTLRDLEDEFLAYAWSAGGWDVSRIYYSGGYTAAGPWHQQAFGCMDDAYAGGDGLAWQVGDKARDMALDAARYGCWSWATKPSADLGRLSEHRARRDATMEADGHRREPWQGLDQWPQTKWLRIARAFDRAHGQDEGLQTVYVLPPKRVQCYRVSGHHPVKWQEPVDHMWHP